MATAIKIGIDNNIIELSGDELKEFELDRAKTHKEYLDRKAQQAENVIKRELILTKLGITAEEAAILLS